MVCAVSGETCSISRARVRPDGAGDGERIRAQVLKMYKRRNYPPEHVAEAIVDAVQTRRSVVPVTAEAWLLWLTSRVSAKLSHAFGRLAERQIPAP